MNRSTRPATAAEARPEPLLGIAFPPPARLPVVFFLVSMPVSAATPLPAGVVDVEGEALEAWRRAS